MANRKGRHLIIQPLDDSRRREAVARFEKLLSSRTQEQDWQDFFDEYPNILSESLSLQLTGLYRQVPLISGRPDYVFHRRLPGKATGDFGVIELKRPDHSILGQYSTKHVIPSRTTVTAASETKRHLQSIRRGEFLNSEDFFIAGNRSHAFIIIGNSKEVSEKCHNEFLRAQFQDMLPGGFHLYTYDEIFEIVTSARTPTIYVIFASGTESDSQTVSAELKITLEIGVCVRPAGSFVETASRFRSDITVKRTDDDREVDGKSIMGLLTLACEPGSAILVTCSGPDAWQQLEAITTLVEEKFGWGD